MLRKLDLSLDDCNFKFKGKAKGEFEGYASVFGNIDKVGDTVFPGAFKESLEQTWPKLFVNHDSMGIPPGDWKHIEEDSTGLAVVGVIDFNHKDGHSLYSALERKAMDATSIGYIAPREHNPANSSGGMDLKKVLLKEISIVTFPCDSFARISGVKAEIDTITSLREAELFLREVGVMSKSTATDFVSRVRTIARREAEQGLHEITEQFNRANKFNSSVTDLARKLADL